MKITVDILGVEQATDFDTMKTSSFLVVNIVGTPMRVPVTEDQLSGLVQAAVQRHTSRSDQPMEEPALEEEPAVFEETMARSTGLDPNTVSEPMEERNYQGPMAGLTETPSEEVSPMSFFESELGRPSTPMEQVKPKPAKQLPPQTALPQMPGIAALSDDDGFAQG